MEGGLGSPSCSNGDTRDILVTSRFPLRWQRNWICRGVKRPENPGTCFPPGREVPRSGKRVYDAARRNDTLWLCDRQTAAIPADWYSLPFDSKAACTEILRFAQNDERAAGRNPEEPEYAARNFMSHIRSLRDLGFSAKSLLSSVACGDTFFQRKKAIALRHAAMETPGAFS